MTNLKIRILLDPPPSRGCCGGPWQQSRALLCGLDFVKNVKSTFGEEIDIQAIPLSSGESGEYPELSGLKARKKLRTPIVLVNNAVKSIGRYPSAEEIEGWKDDEGLGKCSSNA